MKRMKPPLYHSLIVHGFDEPPTSTVLNSHDYILKSAYDKLEAERDELRASREHYKLECMKQEGELLELRAEVERLKQSGEELAAIHAGLDRQHFVLKREFERLDYANNWNAEQIKRLSVELTLEREIAGVLREALEKMPHANYCEYWNECSCEKAALKREAEMRGEK